MKEFLDYVSANDYVTYGLCGLLAILVILFFIVLFSGNGSKKTKTEEIKDNNKEEETKNQNLDFDHKEYVKETTAEFELAPVNEVNPVPDNFEPEVKEEESPAFKTDSNIGPVTNFSFDELSKMISNELNDLDKTTEFSTTTSIPVVEPEEVKPVIAEETKEEIPKVTFVDAFKETETSTRPVEVDKIDEINNIFKPIEEPKKEEKIESFERPRIVLPKLASDAKKEEPVRSEPVINKSSQPVLKEDEIPLFARFNQETYDIKKED